MSSYETCRECDSETGRAGASEDSLYHSYVGPFCEDCYDDWPDKIEAELAKVRREFRDFRAGQAVSVPEGLLNHIVSMIDLHEKRGVVLAVHMQELAEHIGYEPKQEGE